MDVFFADEGMADVCASERKMRRAFGAMRAQRLALRLQQLRVAASLADMRLFTRRCHAMTGDLRGCVAVDLDGPYRLLFRPISANGSAVSLADWSAITAVVVERVVDYH